MDVPVEGAQENTSILVIRTTTALTVQLAGHWTQFPMPPQFVLTALAVVLILYTLVAFMGNTLVIFVFLRFRKLRTPGNMLIINLAVADLLMSVLGYPLGAVANFYGYWPFSNAMCELYGLSGGFFGLLSINSLTGIAVDRYWVIVRSKKCRHLSTSYQHSVIITVSAWLYAAAMACPPLFGWNKYVPEGFGTSCSFDFITDTLLYKSFIIYMNILGFLLPLSVIIFCYMYIFLEVSQYRKHFNEASRKHKFRVSSGSQGSIHKVDFKTAQVSFCCVILFCLSWTPYAVVSWLGVLRYTQLVHPWAVVLCAVFAKASTMYNPIVYAISHPRFREKCFELIGGCRSRRPSTSYTSADMVHFRNLSRRSQRSRSLGEPATHLHSTNV